MLTTEEKALILGALDTLAVELANYGHQWTEGEREIYEQSVKLLTNDPNRPTNEERQL